MDELATWFEQNRRVFPWRKEPSPYRVLISEFMLQQTRASVVVPYFEKFLFLFPDFSTLAKAPVEEVIKAWEGLGYYSRARALSEIAKQVVDRYKGELPSSKEALEKFKGIGPYTVGAVLLFAFGKTAPAVDANVIRVFSRLFCLKEEKLLLRKEVEKRELEILHNSKNASFLAEAFIELGATVCKKTALCFSCPLNKKCGAYKEDRVSFYPILPERQKTILLDRTVYLFEYDKKFLVIKGEKGKIMQDLYEFPYGSFEKDIYKEFVMKNAEMKIFDSVTQFFTKYKVSLKPILVVCTKRPGIIGDWHSLDELKKLPFSSGHRKILQELIEEMT